MSTDRKIALIGAVAAVVALLITLPSAYASNEPGYARWVKDIDHGMTGIGAHLTLQATIVTCSVCLVVELLIAYGLGEAASSLSDAAVRRLHLVGILMQATLAWVLWDADGGHGHKALIWGSAGAYIAAIVCATHAGEQHEMRAAKARKAAEAARAAKAKKAVEAARARSKVVPPTAARGGISSTVDLEQSAADSLWGSDSLVGPRDPLGNRDWPLIDSGFSPGAGTATDPLDLFAPLPRKPDQRP